MILWSNYLFDSVRHISYLDTHGADDVIPSMNIRVAGGIHVGLPPSFSVLAP